MQKIAPPPSQVEIPILLRKPQSLAESLSLTILSQVGLDGGLVVRMEEKH
jgi:hypothetical protein